MFYRFVSISFVFCSFVHLFVCCCCSFCIFWHEQDLKYWICDGIENTIINGKWWSEMFFFRAALTFRAALSVWALFRRTMVNDKCMQSIEYSFDAFAFELHFFSSSNFRLLLLIHPWNDWQIEENNPQPSQCGCVLDVLLSNRVELGLNNNIILILFQFNAGEFDLDTFQKKLYYT